MQAQCNLGRLTGDDWCLTHLQDTVTPLVYQQVTEPGRIVFLGELFQVVCTPWQGATIPQFSTRGNVDKAQCAQYAEALVAERYS